MIYDTFNFDNDLEKFYKKIGENVKKARVSKNLTQLQLAQLLNYKSVATISNAEIYYDKHHFSLAQLYKISLVLDVHLNTLVEI